MKRKNRDHQKQAEKAVNITANKSKILQSRLEELTIQIKFTSDWHIGSGGGIPGDIDSLVQRDQDGLPYIPAKTLTGIWRDACELVAFGLDNGQENGAWQKWVDYLFGEQPALFPKETAPLPAALSIRPGYFPEPLRDILKSKSSLKNALTFVKPGISIDAESGCAIEKFLRFEEVVRCGAILEAKCELNLPNDKNQKAAAYALLIAGTKFVERLGGKRRRGNGKCQLLIINEDIKSHIDWIEKNPQPDSPLIPDLSDKVDTKNIANLSKAEHQVWVEVSLEITTKSPVIISKLTLGNLVETLDYIPGTHLMRLIIGKLSGLGVDLNQAIAHSNIIITNATLEVNKEQGRPIPLALFYEKSGGGLDKGGKVYNRFIQEETEANGQLKGYRVGYIDSTDGKNIPKHETVILTVGTHNTIEDEVQYPTSNLGGIYSYQAIPAGTKLQAKLKLNKIIADVLDKNRKNWRDSLNGNYRIGQSKKDDYGDISLVVLTNKESKYQTLEINNDELTVWLLSTVLLRDERLRPTTDIKYLAQELEAHLKVKLVPKSCEDKKLSFMARTHRIDSWQVRWGLPRPSLVGLAAGTCVVFKVTGKIDKKLLIKIQSIGIGERRVEGYGQVSFNDPILITKMQKPGSKPQVKINQQENSNNNSNYYLEGDSNSIDYARVVEKAAWREIIHRASLFSASNHIFRSQILDIKIQNGESKPSMSQLESLRSVLTRIESPEDEGVKKWIEHLQETKNRADKWPKGSLNKLNQLIINPREVWQHLLSVLVELGHTQGFSEFTLTKTGEEKLQQELWSETLQILIGSCIRAHKRELESQQKNIQEYQEKGEELSGT